MHYNIEGVKHESEDIDNNYHYHCRFGKMTDREIGVIRSYIEASRVVVRCRQRHFHYACQSCKHYNNAMCQTYREYVEAWRKLQELVPRELD